MSQQPSVQQSIVSEQFTIAGCNGIPMAADLFFPKEYEELPVVVYAHGINGFKDWGGMDMVAANFAAKGIAFLKFNFSHNGTTPARLMEFHDLDTYAKDSYLKRQFDIRQVFDFLHSEHHGKILSKSELYLIGHSRGGADAILFASQNEDVKKLITWAAPAHAQTPWKSMDEAEMALWRERGYFTRKNGRTGQDLPINYELFEEWKANKKELDIEASARSVKQDWLIVHGEEDEAVFVKDAYTLKEAASEAEVFIVPKANHTFGRKHPLETSHLPAEMQAVVERSINFLL